MRGLVRHHGMIRALPKTAIASVATATAGLNLLFFESLRRGAVLGIDRTGLFEMVILLGGLYVLQMKEAGGRGAPWVQSLPVDARTLWTAHVRALVLAVSLVMVGMAAAVLGIFGLIPRLDYPGFLSPFILLVHFTRPWLILLAVALCLGSWRPRLMDPRRSQGWTNFRWALAVGAMATLMFLVRLPVPVALIPVLAASVWARYARNGLPPVLVAADQPAGFVDRTGGALSPSRRGVVHWIIVRQLFKWPLTWIIGLPMTFFLGLVMGGAFSHSLEADFVRYFNLWITVYMLVAFFGHFMENLYRVDHLPISRDLLFRWLVLPNLVFLLAGGFFGWTLGMNRDPGESLSFENDLSLSHHGLLVPVDLWRPVWGLPPESVTAPWGESRAVASVPVIEGLPPHLWKPYSTGPEASPDFVAWQISRAAEAVHGTVLDPEVIRQRYLTSGTSGSVQVTQPGLTLVADGLVPARAAVGPILGILMGFTITAALTVLGVMFRMCGQGVSRRRTKTVFWSAMALLMGLHLGGYALLMGHWLLEWKVSALVEGVAARLGNLGPMGWAGAWIVGIFCVLVAWRVASRAFARVEAVPER